MSVTAVVIVPIMVAIVSSAWFVLRHRIEGSE
jgi:hypothetical protein